MKENEEILLEELPEQEQKKWYREAVAFRDVIVRRSGNARSNYVCALQLRPCRAF